MNLRTFFFCSVVISVVAIATILYVTGTGDTPQTADTNVPQPSATSSPFNIQDESNPPPPDIRLDTEAKTISVKLAPSWHGDWEDFSVETSGDFIKDEVRYKWIGGRARLSKKAGCWAYYDGVTSKADWVESFKRVRWDGELKEFAEESKRNLAQLSNKRFKQVTLVCTEKNGEEIPIGADCIYSGYFKDNDAIFEPRTCQIGSVFEISLRKIMRK